MSVESFVSYIVDHNIAIIEGLIGGILLVVLVWGYKVLKSPPDESPTGMPQLGDLEVTLKKLLEKASALPAAGTVSGNAGNGDNGELLLEIEMLKRSLEDRQGELENLRSQKGNDGAATAGLSNEEKMKLESQLKELSGKLAEYEIISEDIADLSFYKEENARLLKQVEEKGAAPISSSAQVQAAVEPVVVVDPLVKPAAAGAKAEPEIVGRSKTKESAPPPPPAPASDEAEIMAEFSKAVEEQHHAGVAAEPAPVAAEPVSVAADSVAAEPAPVAMDLGGMDMEKMLAEASDIQAAPVVEVENSLESTMDENKLLAEATALQDDTGQVKSEDKELMNEFENFVKKGS